MQPPRDEDAGDGVAWQRYRYRDNPGEDRGSCTDLRHWLSEYALSGLFNPVNT